MHEQTFSNKMCGTRPFTLRDLTRIADFFDVSVDFLLGRSDYVLCETVGGGVMAGVERVSVHVSRLAHCPDVFFVEFSRAGSVGNLVVPLDRSEAEALRDELGEALSGRITEAPDVS